MAIDEALDTYDAPKDGWVCFHCGVRFIDADAAERHFGRTPNGAAGCVLLRSEKKQLDAIRKLENDRDEWQERALRAEEREEGLALEQRRVLQRCTWKHDDYTDSWDTECGEKWQFTEGGPQENKCYFCPYCGGMLNAILAAAMERGKKV